MKRQTWGHSLLLDPWGEVLGELEHQEGVRVAEVKRTLLTQVREAMPLWNRARLARCTDQVFNQLEEF